jgi:peptide/nickel transport system permease protein
VAGYLLQRLVYAAATLLLVSMIAFLLARALPGDPAQAILGLRATPELIGQIRSQLGLDQPLVVQYVHWLYGAIRGNIGTSMATSGSGIASSGTPVSTLVAQGLRVSGPLTVLGTLIAVVIGVPLGVLAASQRGRALDTGLSIVSVVGLSVPGFYLAWLLILLFGVKLRWLPTVGYVDFRDSLSGYLRSIAMPALAIGLINATAVARTARAATVEALASSWVQLLRARGTPGAVVLFKHALRNALLPVLTVIGLQLGYLFGGVVVIENMFALPGMGRELLLAVEQRDYPTMQALIVVFAGLFILVNLAVDLLYPFIDPRVRDGGA